jgi:hypothetical protein
MTEECDKASNDNPELKNGAHNKYLKLDYTKSSSSLSSEPQQQKMILIVDDNPDIVFTFHVGLVSNPIIQVFSFDNPITALVEYKPNL